MNKRIITLIIALAVLCGGAMAQQKQGHARIPVSRNVGKGTVVDHTKVRVWYALNADKIDDMNTYIDFQRLDIGDSITKCCSWFVFNSDSLRAEWGKKNRNAQGARCGWDQAARSKTTGASMNGRTSTSRKDN